MKSVVVILIVILLLAGGAFYFVSDPFKTNVDMKVEQATKWTPENIQKDPVGYVTWAIGQADATIKTIEARRIAISQQKAKNDRMIVQVAADFQAARKVFGKLRDAYKKGSQAGSWPTECEDKLYTERELKNTIVLMHRRAEAGKTRKKQLGQMQDKLMSHMALLDQKLNESKATKTELLQKLEMLKAKKIVDNIGALRADIDGLAGVTDAIAGIDALPSVDALIEQEKSRVSDEEFKKILGAGE